MTLSAAKPHWATAQPWQTNAAFVGLGIAMLAFTRQLVSEYDHYHLGFDTVSAVQILLYLGAVLLLLLRPANVDRYTLPIILLFAVLCRLVGLFPEPVLSSDVYRYAWDGVVQHAGINPYRYVPGDPALAFLRAPNQDLFDNMNRRDYARTIYPPVAQFCFYLITFISPTVTFMKMAMVLLEGVTLIGLLKLLRHLGIRREWTIVYAWCPMLIWEIGSSGHLDSMVMASMVLALLFRYRGQPVLTGIFLAFAVLTKFYPLALFPALYQRGDWKMPATMAAVAALFYAPYLSAGKYVFGFLGGYVQEEGMSTGTRYFLLEGLQHLPGMAGFPSIGFLTAVGVIVALIMVWAWRTGCRAESAPDAFLRPAFALALTMMLAFSPHYPWYVAWLVPFLVLTPSFAGMTYVLGLFYLCTTALAVGSGPKQFRLNEILYSAVLIALIMQIAAHRFSPTSNWLRQRWNCLRFTPEVDVSPRFP